MFGPGLFALDDAGHAFVEDDEVPPGLEDAVRTVAARCPERAIVVEAETPVPTKRGTP
jgi:ferredoxin